MTILCKRICFLLMTVSSFSPALRAQEINPPDTADLRGIHITKTELYDPETLWNYNPGNTDLLLEFGFRSLLIQEYQYADRSVRLEVYKLGSPESAFGIYSLSVIKCSLRDTLTRFDCLGSHQYQAAYGSYYLVMTPISGGGLDFDFFNRLTTVLQMKNPQPEFELPEPFNHPNLLSSRSNLAFVLGPAGMQNCMYPWQNLFLGIHFGMYATLLAHPDFDVYFARIRFANPQGLMTFLGKAGLTDRGIPVPNTNTNDGLYREFQQIDDLTIYFLQSQEPFPIMAILEVRGGQ
ncbi:MAG: hypothetical protein EOM90_07515 [Alphaproteobacteria bacterium]|nr:hypothetical protein [Alphaproteobacteria bacterium]